MLYGIEYGNGKAFICDRFPDCRGSVSVDPQDKPLGFIADPETKALRYKLHAIIDPLWKDVENGRSKKRNRGSVYGWLQRIMELSPRECHIAMFDREDCLRAMKLIYENPYDQRPEKEDE